mgnify:CR=1 FL=1
MLQKIVNGIAIASGVVSLAVIGLGGYVFIRKDAIIENVKGKVMEAVSGKIGDALGTGALEGISGQLSLPAPSNPMATPDSPSTPPVGGGFGGVPSDSTPTEPVLPLGF